MGPVVLFFLRTIFSYLRFYCQQLPLGNSHSPKRVQPSARFIVSVFVWTLCLGPQDMHVSLSKESVLALCHFLCHAGSGHGSSSSSAGLVARMFFFFFFPHRLADRTKLKGSHLLHLQKQHRIESATPTIVRYVTMLEHASATRFSICFFAKQTSNWMAIYGSKCSKSGPPTFYELLRDKQVFFLIKIQKNYTLIILIRPTLKTYEVGFSSLLFLVALYIFIIYNVNKNRLPRLFDLVRWRWCLPIGWRNPRGLGGTTTPGDGA